MRNMKKTPIEIYGEYQSGVNYNNSIDLYEVVKRNNNFFNDKQWEGVVAPELDKPVFNILKPVINYFIAMIVSDDVAASVELFSPTASQADKMVLPIIAKQFDEIIENSKVKTKQRQMLRNAAVDGDGCLYFYFNTQREIGQSARGAIECELVDNTNVIFGNVTDGEVENQPYIIIVSRRLLDSVKQDAMKRGMAKSVVDGIFADNEDALDTNENDTPYVTVLTKLFKEGGRVHFIQCTATVTLLEDTDTGLYLYPVAFMPWERVKNSYHGMSAMTGKIQNQVYVNKLYAMAMQYIKMTAFPKKVYNRTLFPRGFSNKIGEAIGVDGDPREAVSVSEGSSDMSGYVMQMIDRTIAQTKELMGASDAALGNVKADNTSAIIAVQKAAAVPLELTKMDFYQFVEDYIRIFLDMMRAYYGVRKVFVEDPNTGETQVLTFDFDSLEGLHLKLNVDIGASSYFSEMVQVQTLDNLFAKGLIRDGVTYLEGIPDKYIKNKAKLIAKLKSQQAKEEEMIAMGQANGGGQMPPPGMM